MTAIRFQGMGGAIPRVSPRLLPLNSAVMTLDADLLSNDIQPWRAPLSVYTPSNASPGTLKTIYRWGQSVISDTQYWLAWQTDVDVIRGPIATDTNERTYWTGEGVPKMGDSTVLATGPFSTTGIGGTAYPAASYTLGLPAPVDAPTLAASGSGTGTAQAKAYVYTYVTTFGEEGPPSPPATISIQPGQGVNLSGMDTAPPVVAGYNYSLQYKRIYRTLSGKTGTAYQFVAQVAVATTAYADTAADTALGAGITTIGYIQPPANMSGLCMMPNGIAAGFHDKEVCLSVPYLPYAWPIAYRYTVDFPIVGLAVLGHSLVVLTTGNPYILYGTDPSNMTSERVGSPAACVSKRSIVVMHNNVYYAGTDGIMKLNQYSLQQGVQLASNSLFTIDQWKSFVPSSIVAYQWNGRYMGFYNTGGAVSNVTGTATGGIIFSDQDEPVLSFTSLSPTAGYRDPQNGELYLNLGGVIKKWHADPNNSLTASWTSKVVELRRGESMGCGRVSAAAFPVTIKIYGDGVLFHTRVASSSYIFRLPSLNAYKEYQINISSVNTVYEVHIANSVKQLLTVDEGQSN